MIEDCAETAESTRASNARPSDRSQPTNNALIASDAPGRLRIRLNRETRGPQTLRHIQERFRDVNGISPIETNAETGSVVVHYDTDKHRRDEIMGALADAGVIVRDVAEGLGEELPAMGRSHASENLIAAFNQFDRRLALATGYRADLKVAFPFVLGGVGVWRLFNSGFGLTEIPAYVLLWYAFDAFFKLNVTTTRSDSPEANLA